jgi:hypothetical protein
VVGILIIPECRLAEQLRDSPQVGEELRIGDSAVPRLELEVVHPVGYRQSAFVHRAVW